MPIVDLTSSRKKGNNSTGGSYDGNKDLGDLNNWKILSSDSNKILSGVYGILSERSTTLYHTYAPVKAAINKNVTYGVGPGLVYRNQPDFKRLGMSVESAKSFAKDFDKIVHYYFTRFNFYEKQPILFRSAMYSGDSWLWFERKNGQLTDLIESLNNQVDWRFRSEGFTLGIQHDSMLRKKAVRKVDGTTVNFQDSMNDQNVVQCYFKELGRQLRGYPLAYSVINMSRNDDQHTDAITHRAVMEAMFIAAMKSSGTDFQSELKALADANRKRKGKFSNPFKKVGNADNLGSGNFMTMKTDESVEMFDMKTPSNTYDMFKRWMVRYVGMATDTPPEVIMSEYGGSFTAHKGAFNDFIKAYEKKRKTFERTVMDVVVREIMKDAIMQGFISAPGFLTGDWMVQMAYLQGMYLGPIPGHINPLVEVKAKREKVKAGFDKPSTFALENGHDWDIFQPQWMEEQIQWASAPDDFKAWQLWKQETGANT